MSILLTILTWLGLSVLVVAFALGIVFAIARYKERHQNRIRGLSQPAEYPDITSLADGSAAAGSGKTHFVTCLVARRKVTPTHLPSPARTRGMECRGPIRISKGAGYAAAIDSAMRV